jgi:C4-type Zn-finger protein
MAEMEAKETVGKVVCPSCNRAMTVTDCHQIVFSEGLVQAMYRCNNCAAEATVMREQGAEPR